MLLQSKRKHRWHLRNSLEVETCQRENISILEGDGKAQEIKKFNTIEREHGVENLQKENIQVN